MNQAFTKMHPIELQSDLKSEVFLVLAEMPEEKLIQLYENKHLRFYIVRVMINMVSSSTNQFYKNYRNYSEFSGDIIENEQTDISKKITESFEDLHWYKKEIMRLYTHEFKCNAKELSRNTGIPYISIIRTINSVKKELKSKIRTHD